jgi:hypothetical protein
VEYNESREVSSRLGVGRLVSRSGRSRFKKISGGLEKAWHQSCTVLDPLLVHQSLLQRSWQGLEVMARC